MKLPQMKRYEIGMKHAKKFASKSEGRPVLCGAYHREDGALIVADGSRLLRVKDAHTSDKPSIVHVKEWREIDGTYPDVERIFPKAFKAEFAVIGDAKDVAQRIKLICDIGKLVDKRRPIMYIDRVDNSVYAATENEKGGIKACLKLTDAVDGEIEETWFDTNYMLDAINVFKDLDSRRITFKYTGKLNPLLISDEENEVDVLLVPIRKERDKSSHQS